MKYIFLYPTNTKRLETGDTNIAFHTMSSVFWWFLEAIALLQAPTILASHLNSAIFNNIGDILYSQEYQKGATRLP